MSPPDITTAARRIRLLMKLRRSGITDRAVLGAIERIPREAFVPETFIDQAYEDIALPIGRGQTISQPLVVAAMTQAMKLSDRHKVLEVGTGSGYQAAILSRLCRRVYSIERHRPLLDIAEARFKQLRLHNITTVAGDGMKGWPEQAPFDRIIVTAAASQEPPKALLDQLSIGGLLVIPLGKQNGDQFIYRITRTEDGYESEKMMPVRFVPLLPDIAPDNLEETESPHKTAQKNNPPPKEETAKENEFSLPFAGDLSLAGI
ncbi:MAG: protein-L-isoaspartate(D-aspartate) O-methyltransferase [Pseudomonadota bacterium]|jgi:protein-L-isoaspartate(D-aspartate) O-methyltransferase|nr:protein-L-isoaspartate(D-aspartate) O-methyltransferase [Pseudomonadota bacterium]QKK06496.1 MAG: protein-L-isoaspartate(D-aspartate) O-methyltransferase [Pseudomonadota bacterium]